MEPKELKLTIELPCPLPEIKDRIIFESVKIWGTQKLAAANLGISEATVSRRLNKIRRGSTQPAQKGIE